MQAVYHAIGYQPESVPGIAYDERGAHLANANGDGRITVDHETPDVRERLYATGWAKRGPVGLIGSTKSDALLIVTNMLEDLSAAKEHVHILGHLADREQFLDHLAGQLVFGRLLDCVVVEFEVIFVNDRRDQGQAAAHPGRRP